MRILIAHNRYQERGGEDIVVANETKLLGKLGHDVDTFMVDNDDIVGFRKRVEAALQVLDNPPVTEAFERRLAEFDPQIVHFHNFFPRLTPGAVQKSIARGIATLHTLHNYRLVCASADFLRDGAVCEDCLGSSWRIPAIRHGCYRKSRIGSYFVGRIGRAYRHIVDRSENHLTLVALTEFGRRQMSRDGYDASRIVVKGNAAPDAGLGPEQPERRIVFVGRLSPEKGADLLLRVAPRLDAQIEIIGDGQERSRLAAEAPQNVTIRGWLDHEAVIDRIKGAAAVAMPSRWYEGFPMVLAEAMSAGIPVVASRLGSLAELVEDGISGVTLPVDDEAAWTTALRRILDDAEWRTRLRDGARRAYDEKHNERANGDRLVEIYENAIARAAAANASDGTPGKGMRPASSVMAG